MIILPFALPGVTILGVLRTILGDVLGTGTAVVLAAGATTFVVT